MHLRSKNQTHHCSIESVIDKKTQDSSTKEKLRIEVQGKYLKKIIEEQQRLSGVLAETPGVSIHAPTSGDHYLDSDKMDPSTPAPTSESPLQDKAASGDHGGTGGLFKSLSHDDSFSSRREPLTPDSSYYTGSLESPRRERPIKR
ncbi:hypothetical protein COCNU_scaffold007776G000020 [Cocos nucifera]|nr:hypothetical protein [Cocos nucifera]